MSSPGFAGNGGALECPFLNRFDHANEDVPTAEDKVVKPSRRLSLVIWFRGTQRVAARARHLVELALRCDAME